MQEILLYETGAQFETPRAAAHDAVRLVNAACLYALFLTQTWLDLLACQVNEYSEGPMRYLEAMTDLVHDDVEDRA